MASPSQQQQSGDNSLAPLWIAIALFIAGWLLWSCFHTQIVHFVLLIKTWELKGIAFFLPTVTSSVTELTHLVDDQISFMQLLKICQEIGYYLRYPVLIALICLAFVIYFSHVNSKFKKSYSMKALAEAEKTNWPQISPVLKLDLIKEDIDKGPWAMALTPMQFAKKHNLLQEEKTISTLTMASHTSRNQIIMKVRREAAHQVFALQLGNYWQDETTLTKSNLALLAIFAARANRDRKGSQLLLENIAKSTEKSKPDFSGVDAVWKQHRQSKSIQHVINSHAYVLTVMASMLELARRDGVLASADFLWLKPLDRKMWFMLNSIGRQTVFPEVAGPFAHWKLERVMQRRLLVPMVEEAVNGLDAAIKDILYVPDIE